jgi:hypothetical protein
MRPILDCFDHKNALGGINFLKDISQRNGDIYRSSIIPMPKSQEKRNIQEITGSCIYYGLFMFLDIQYGPYVTK